MTLTLLRLYVTLGLLVYGLAFSTVRIPTLDDVQFMSQTTPGGKRVYTTLYER